MNPIELRRRRCINGAYGNLQRLASYTAEDIILASYVHTDNEAAKEILKFYERAIVLAKVNPERYVKERDEFQQKLSAYIHKNKLYREWFDFIYFLNHHMEESRMLDAYKSEAMETWVYLSEKRGQKIFGLTSDNKLLYCEDQFGDWDIEIHRLAKLYEQNRISHEKFMQKTKELAHLYAIERHENIVDVTIFEMLPFMNERTQTILPRKWMEMGYADNIVLPRKWKETDVYREAIRKRKFMIHKKGCKAFLRNAGNIKEVCFIEDVKKDKKIVMMYRVSTDQGSFMGYYNLNDEYFFSPYRSTDHKEIHFGLENFILELYAEIVSGLEKDVKRLYALKEVEDIDNIPDYKPTHVYVQFNLYNEKTDRDELSGNKRHIKQRPHERSMAIRRLPAGQKASEEAIQRAKEYGIELQEGYTFVRPYRVGGVKDVRKEIRKDG